jgi:hypothetical protein
VPWVGKATKIPKKANRREGQKIKVNVGEDV